jgi:hypothetical protein
MSVEADLSGIKNSNSICWEYSDDPEGLHLDDGWKMDSTSGMMVRMSPKTSGLIIASSELHLNHISARNLLEWIYRLDSFFDAGKSYLATWTVEGEVPIRIGIHDLRDHIGLKTTSSNWAKSRFDTRVRELRIVRHLENLSSDLG